jgi:hypothetical protein
MIIDPQIPGIRILEESGAPADGVMFQNLWDSAIVGMNWTFRFIDGTSASSGSDDLGNVRLSSGEIAVAVPRQMIVVDRPQEPERRLWSGTQPITAEYVEFLLRTREGVMGQGAAASPALEKRHLDDQWNERTAEKLRSAYERRGVPSDCVPSVDELKYQLEDCQRQLDQRQRVKPIPNEIRISWVLFEDGLFYGPTRTAYCLLLSSFSRKIASTVSGTDELVRLVEQLPDSDRQIIKTIVPIPG